MKEVISLWENDSTYREIHTQLPGTNGGDGGDGGRGGNGGDGGNIYIDYTRSAETHLHLIEAKSIAGRGGSGGNGGSAGSGGKGGSGNPRATREVPVFQVYLDLAAQVVNRDRSGTCLFRID